MSFRMLINIEILKWGVLMNRAAQVSKNLIPTEIVLTSQHEYFDLSKLSFCAKANIDMGTDDLISTERSALAPLQSILPEDLTVVRDRLISDQHFWLTLRGNTEVEFDAEKLCKYLDQRSNAGSLNLSADFLRFREIWRRDELRHAIGFAYLEFLLSGVWIADRQAEVLELPSNIVKLEEAGLLFDELHLLILIAYDEICTTRAYHHELTFNYHRWQQPTISNWLRGVAAEEAHHFRNACKIIRDKYKGRHKDVEQIVDRVYRFDRDCTDYQGLFVLDHGDRDLYTPRFLADAAEMVLKTCLSRS